MREIGITTDFERLDIDEYYETVTGGLVTFCGYEGEADAVQLNIDISTDYLDYEIYLMFHTDNTWYEQGPYEVDAETIRFTIPAEYMNPEYLVLVIEARLGSEVIKSPPVYLEVKR